LYLFSLIGLPLIIHTQSPRTAANFRFYISGYVSQIWYDGFSARFFKVVLETLDTYTALGVMTSD